MLLTFIHDGNSNDDLGSQQKLPDLQIAHWCRTISRLCNQLVHNVKIGMNFPESENAQRNLEIVFLDCAEHIY